MCPRTNRYKWSCLFCPLYKWPKTQINGEFPGNKNPYLLGRYITTSWWLNHPFEKYYSKLDHFSKDSGWTLKKCVSCHHLDIYSLHDKGPWFCIRLKGDSTPLGGHKEDTNHNQSRHSQRQPTNSNYHVPQFQVAEVSVKFTCETSKGPMKTCGKGMESSEPEKNHAFSYPYHPWDWCIYLHERLIFMVNVGNYIIHGWYMG